VSRPDKTVEMTIDKLAYQFGRILGLNYDARRYASGAAHTPSAAVGWAAVRLWEAGLPERNDAPLAGQLITTNNGENTRQRKKGFWDHRSP
jgi:hypothetical protein